MTTLGGVQVDQHFSNFNFGALGEITYTVLSGLLLMQLLRDEVVRSAVGTA